MTTPTSVLFVCVRNGGKSQMAAGLARAIAPHLVIDSAGSDPGDALNELSVLSLAELGIDISSEQPKHLDITLISRADLIVVLGDQAQVRPDDDTPVIRWNTDEPSTRGIEGLERMRLIRDDISIRVCELLVPNEPRGPHTARTTGTGVLPP